MHPDDQKFDEFEENPEEMLVHNEKSQLVEGMDLEAIFPPENPGKKLEFMPQDKELDFSKTAAFMPGAKVWNIDEVCDSIRSTKAGRSFILDAYLESGNDVNQEDSNGNRTPYHALVVANIDIIHQLKDCGGELNEKDKLSLADLLKHYVDYQVGGDSEIIVLIENGVDPNWNGTNGVDGVGNPIDYANSIGKPDLANLMVEKWAEYQQKLIQKAKEVELQIEQGAETPMAELAQDPKLIEKKKRFLDGKRSLSDMISSILSKGKGGNRNDPGKGGRDGGY